MKRFRFSRVVWLLGVTALVLLLTAAVVTMPSVLANDPVPALERVADPGLPAPSPVELQGVTPAADDGGAWEVGVHWSAADLVAQASSEGWGLYNRLGSCGWNRRYIYDNTWAWEEDFKRIDGPGGGMEWQYLDTVDLQFYVGHGGPGFFTFANAAHDDRWLTTSDCYRSWGDNDNEWVALTSCQVLANSAVAGWANCQKGNHLILGFVTNAAAQTGTWTQGWNFANYLCWGYNVPQAWYWAAKRSQPPGRVVRTIINELNCLDDNPRYSRVCADSWDYDAWMQTVSSGSELPRPMDVAALEGQMPIFSTPPMSLDEARNEAGHLGQVFNLPAPGPSWLNQDGGLWTSMQNGQALEMDPAGGLYGYVDLNTMWSERQAETAFALQSVGITAEDARTIADRFLNENGLMPPDARFYEVAPDTLGSLEAVADAAGEGITYKLTNERVTAWQVVYSRILTYETHLNQTTTEFMVVGPGAKLQVYVSTDGSLLNSHLQTPVLGVIGGWRKTGQQLNRAEVAATVPILTQAQIIALYGQVGNLVALNEIPIDADARQVISSTVAYWENAAGNDQDQLVPVYALWVNFLKAGQPVTADFVYVPANPRYMRPFARIETYPRTPVRVGDVVRLVATEASRTLADLGYDASLNFPLGSGSPDDYIYDWYVNDISDANKIGSGRSIDYTVNGLVEDRSGQPTQTIILVVTDITSPNQHKTRTSVTIDVQPRVVLPLVLRGYTR